MTRPAFSPDGRFLLTGSGNSFQARVWLVGRWTPLTDLNGHTDSLNDLAFAAGGRLAVTTSDDQTARIWNVATGEIVATLRGHNRGVRAAAFSPNATVVASVAGKTARVWDARTGEQLAVFRGGRLREIGFSRDGKSIWSTSDSIQGDGTIRIFRCTVCASLQELMIRAADLATIRPWTKEEREQYVPNGTHRKQLIH
jgi:WD40 repeat protein